MVNMWPILSISMFFQDNHHQIIQQFQCKRHVCSSILKTTWTGIDGFERVLLIREYLKSIR